MTTEQLADEIHEIIKLRFFEAQCLKGSMRSKIGKATRWVMRDIDARVRIEREDYEDQ